MERCSRIMAAWILLVLTTIVSAAPNAAPKTAARGAKFEKSKSPAVDWAKSEAAAVVAQLETTGDYTNAGNQLGALFDALIINGDDDALAALPELAKPLRLVTQLSACDEPLRKRLLPYLREHPAVADALALSIAPGDDVPAAARGPGTSCVP